MRDRGKAVEVYNNNNNNNNNNNSNSNEFVQDYSCSPSDLPCRKHPQSSPSVGICPYCLKDRLVKLVCSDCGEQRLSSCSCSSDLSASSNRNSCSVEVGSVGRVSFLIENEKKDEFFINPQNNNNSINNKTKSSSSRASVAAEKPPHPEVILLKRSNSSCVEIKKKNGLWRIGRLFRKSKRESGNKDYGGGGRSSFGGCEEKNDLWVVDYMGGGGVSRSRSLCSFRGGGGLLFGSSEDGGDVMSCYSGARSSISAARSSGVNGGMLFDPERRSGFSEAEPRKSGFDSSGDQKRDSCCSVMEPEFNRRVCSLKESYNFTGGEDPGFIDLKFDSSSEAKGDHHHHSSVKRVLSDSNHSVRGGDQYVPSDHSGEGMMLGHGGGGSCRITVNERGIKKSRKSFKGWRWIFKHHPNWINNGRKKDEEDQVRVNP